MRLVVFDVFELVKGHGKSHGLYRFACNLFHSLIQQIPNDTQILLVYNSLNYGDFIKEPITSANVLVECKTISRMTDLKKLWWELWEAPTLVTDIPAHREIFGDTVDYANADDLDAIEAYLQRHSEIRSSKTETIDWAQRFPWSRNAQQTWDMLIQ